MLSPKENYLAVINHEKPDFVPDIALDAIMAGGAFETFENGPLGGGPDEFGLEWVCTASANGQATPKPDCISIPDVTEWKKYLKLPDLAKFDWEGLAKMQLGAADPGEKVVVYGTWNSIFLRFSHLLGFEEALIAMYEEPEACMELMQAIADYKCDLIGQVGKYFKPDIITHYDDVCTERGPFMPPELYRQMIKPMHKQMNDAIKSVGALPSQHCCGFAEELIPDYIDEGAVSWEAAQPSNDIVKILREYGDKFVVVGGYDTQGLAGRADVTDEEIETEVKRMLDTYAPEGSFITMGFLLTNDPDPMAFVRSMMRIAGYTDKMRYNYY